jgi:hypothetical protein
MCCVVLSLPWIFGSGGGIFNPLYHSGSNLLGLLLSITIVIGLSLYASIRLYVVIENKNIYRIDYFCLKTTAEIADIETISYPPTFTFGGNNRTLVILAKMREGDKKITMSYPAFGRETLIKVVEELKKRNPRIRIAEDVNAMYQKEEKVRREPV